MRAQDVPLGATYRGAGRTRFCVWALSHRRVEVHLHQPEDRILPLEPAGGGYFTGTFDGVPSGSLYTYRLDGQAERPDPASRAQPQGVHGPSKVVDPAFPWHDAAWKGLPLTEYILYEIHVGTFTPEGTFAAAIARLDDLKDLGITAVELMPVAQFPGTRNWGYDGVYPFAVQGSYGGPVGLKQFVDACHGRGLAVVLDVVYNHLGPEGNYLADFAPYYTDQYCTPWGPALNFDGRHSDEVRRFFFENAQTWAFEFHLDGLRLDAIHAMKDFSAWHVLQDLAEMMPAWKLHRGRPFYLIAESNLNDPRIVALQQAGGWGLDAQWSDDFHHALHALLTGERQGYYQDFGGVEPLARAYGDGFAFTGEFSHYRGRRHGRPARLVPAWRHIVCAQNHDQVGNRLGGERLSQLVNFEGLKLAAGTVLLAPFVPLLFMGEEYGETAPFPYFISHGDPALVEAVRQGRRREFAQFHWAGEPPDPQDERTFQSARLRPQLAKDGQYRVLRDFYRELIRLRKSVPALAYLSKNHLEISTAGGTALLLRRWSPDGDEVFLVLNFGAVPARISAPAGHWHKLLDSALPRWLGAGGNVDEDLAASDALTLSVAPGSCVLFRKASPCQSGGRSGEKQ
jgi:maltooligosyltrehalose trehalohydrolase